MELGGGGVGDSRPRISTIEKDLMPSMEERWDGAAAAAWLGGGDCDLRAGGAVTVCGGGGGGLGEVSLELAAIRRRLRGLK